MEFGLLFLPAALFPAIPLMMINYANRYSSLSALIRKIHDELIEKKPTQREKDTKRYIDQIVILRKRLKLNRTFQTLGAISFFVNLISIFFGYKLISNNTSIYFEPLFIYTFLLGLLIFSASIALFIYELQLSVAALNKHLEDIEEL